MKRSLKKKANLERRMADNYVRLAHNDSVENTSDFVRWAADWIEVEI